MAVVKTGGHGYWADRMGCKVNGVNISGQEEMTFEQLKMFLDAMAAYTNARLLRYQMTRTTTERAAAAGTASTGHFDLAGYVAKMSFYNYAAEDAGDSPNVSLQLLMPKDAILEETKTGIWVVKEATGHAIAGHLATALGLGSTDIEYTSGEVPEN